MTISQIIEGLCSKVFCINPDDPDDAIRFCTPFKPFDVENIEKKLKECGYDRFGNEMMIDPFTGRIMAQSVFLVPLRYQRLKHLVADKLHARSRGSVTKILRQPQEGKSKGGG
jgi:DNA-directed RNA polymerase II subunit RPB2